MRENKNKWVNTDNGFSPSEKDAAGHLHLIK